MTKLYKLLVVMFLCVMTGVSMTSCSSDSKSEPDSGSGSIVGTWIYSNEMPDYGTKVQTTLKFNSDHTGYISEIWTYSTKASSSDEMEFSWSTTSDANGNDILRISYMSGDKTTTLFPGEDTVLWTCRYALTGNILNIYVGDNTVRVFNRK